MTILRMDNVGIVVNDPEAVIAFFVELGVEVEGERTVQGRSVDRIVGRSTVSEATSQCCGRRTDTADLN
jgi:hypothetical protein